MDYGKREVAKHLLNIFDLYPTLSKESKDFIIEITKEYLEFMEKYL